MHPSARKRVSALVGCGLCTSIAFAVACSGAGDTYSSGGSGSSGTGVAQGGGDPSGGQGGSSSSLIFENSGSGGSTSTGINEDDACASQEEEANLVTAPVDVIFVIDNSGSMSDEIQGVQNNINQNFASIIEASGIDYRVIMVTNHGLWSSGQDVCIEAPLSGIPQTGCNSPPPWPVNNPPKFFHYDQNVESHDAWCWLANTFAKPDQWGFAPGGWQQWLRPEAIKFFVVITDDGVSCTVSGGPNFNDGNNVNAGQTAANNFDSYLLSMSPQQFGTAMDRRYRWFSIIGIGDRDPSNFAVPWTPQDPMSTTRCPTGVDPGTGYQALSIMTGGLRFPTCRDQFFDVIFNEMAKGVIAGAALPCEFELPVPPPGEIIDLKTVVVRYTPGNGGPPVDFKQVAGPASCGPNSFYLENDLIKLCPDACSVIEKDENANIKVLYSCSAIAQ